MRLTRTAVVPLLALALAACGSGGGKADVATAGGKAKSSPAAQTGNQKDQERKWAQCMRANGADVPDEQGGQAAVSSGETKDFTKAMDKCRELMPSGGDLPKPKPEDITKLRAYSKCMRDHGLDKFPDPTSDGGILLEAKTIQDGPTFEKAAKACEKLMPGGAGGGVRIGIAGGGS